MILGPDNKRSALRVDATGRLLVSGGGGGSGGGFAATVFNIPSGGSVSVTTPGATTTAYSEHVAIIRQPASGSPGTFTLSGHGLDGVLPPIRATLGAELLLYRYTTDSGATWRAVGLQPGESIGDWAYTALPAAASLPGIIASATGILSSRSVLVQSNGTRWRYLSGRVALASPTAPQTPHAQTTENNTGRFGSNVVVPAGLLQVGDVLEFWYAQDKVNDNGVGNVSIRLGDQGDTTDAALANIATAPSPATSNSYAFTAQFRVESATTLRPLGNGSQLWNGSATAQAPALVTVDSMTANPVQIALRNWVASASDTISATDFRIIHHTP